MVNWYGISQKSMLPPTSPITETSTPATIETTTGVHKHPQKIEGTKASVRRQLLKDDTHEGMGTVAKKSKQEELPYTSLLRPS